MKNEITAQIEGEGANRVLVVRVPMNVRPEPSASGKTLVVATSHGNQVTTVEVDGRPVTVGVNAYIKNPHKG